MVRKKKTNKKSRGEDKAIGSIDDKSVYDGVQKILGYPHQHAAVEKVNRKIELHASTNLSESGEQREGPPSAPIYTERGGKEEPKEQ